MIGIRMLAAMMGNEDDSSGLIKAAKDLSGAFNNLLGALNPGDGKVRTRTFYVLPLTR